MEPRQVFENTSNRLGNSVPSQEAVFEDIYYKVQAEYGVDGIAELVRFVTSKAISEREQTLKNLEGEAIAVKRAIELIQSVMPEQKIKARPADY